MLSASRLSTQALSASTAAAEQHHQQQQMAGARDASNGQQQPQQQTQQAQQQQQHQGDPYIGWDLTLHPKALNTAYWRDRAPKHSQWDFQVVLFLSVTLLALSLKFLQQMGLTRVTLSFSVAWLMCISWGVALYCPAFYLPNRIPIVLVGRALMAISSHLATNGVQEQLYKTLMFPSAKLSLFFKMFLFCNTGQMPVESVRLQLPILWQMVATGGKALALFASEFTSKFVTFCNSPRYLTALGEMNGFWASFVQSGAPLPLGTSSRLAGRSCGAVMAVTTFWMTDCLLIGYLCYMSLWSDMRLWLTQKARDAALASQQQQQGQSGDTFVVNGVVLTRGRVQCMCHSSFALLLNARGRVGAVSRVLLHCGLINLMCIVAWLLSHLLVQQLLPAVLPDALLDVYFQQLPAGFPAQSVANCSAAASASLTAAGGGGAAGGGNGSCGA